jgi:hypothetical protein
MMQGSATKHLQILHTFLKSLPHPNGHGSLRPLLLLEKVAFFIAFTSFCNSSRVLCIFTTKALVATNCAINAPNEGSVSIGN